MNFRAWLVLLALSPAAWAGVINGIVLEQSSGRPVGRSRVQLQVLRENRLESVSVLFSDRGGQFHFTSLAPGYYILSATRAGFAVTTYRQSRRNGPGTPIVVTADSVNFSELRLKRLGAVSGRVLDENGVGLPDILVLAYSAAIPLRSASSATSDDRGYYRIGGLEPGRYYIRSGARELDQEFAFLPTFSPETALPKEAKIVAVDLEQEIPDVDLRPLPGRLLRFSVRVACAASAKVTLSFDTGRKQATVLCPGDAVFEGLAPGNYEVLAEEGATAAHQEVLLDQDRQSVNVLVVPAPTIRLVFGTGQPGPSGKSFPVVARRKDLAGEGELVRIAADTVRLLPGYWEFTASPPDGSYLVSIRPRNDNRKLSKAGQDPDWQEVYLPQLQRNDLNVTTSPRIGRISGHVTGDGQASAGAPVYLFPVTPEARKSLNGTRTALADPQGAYRFDNLPPGRYLLASSFDLPVVTEDTLTAARAESLSLEEGQTATRDLVLYQVQ